MTPDRRKQFQVASPAGRIGLLGLVASSCLGSLGPAESPRPEISNDLHDPWIDISARRGLTGMASHSILPGILPPMARV